jgi:hypothetical protein
MVCLIHEQTGVFCLVYKETTLEILEKLYSDQNNWIEFRVLS